MPDMQDFNAQIIAEFRANDGVVGGPFEGATIVLLHTTGARSGLERVNPVVCPARGRGPLRLRLEGRRPERSRLVPQPGGAPRR